MHWHNSWIFPGIGKKCCFLLFTFMSKRILLVIFCFFLVLIFVAQKCFVLSRLIFFLFDYFSKFIWNFVFSFIFLLLLLLLLHSYCMHLRRKFVLFCMDLCWLRFGLFGFICSKCSWGGAEGTRNMKLQIYFCMQ